MKREEIDQYVLEVTRAEGVTDRETVQSLWSGYGSIVRMGLRGAEIPSVVVKHVRPGAGSHPRGWNTDLSHQRKLKSYQVETHWYQEAGSSGEESHARMPKCLGTKFDEDEVLLVLEDLNAAGFAERRNAVTEIEWQACVRWLAGFHADRMGASTDGLWTSGTYWHLETRPDELEVLDDLPLKNAAAAIDAKLKASPFQTLVHGDAKLANFCFSTDGSRVAAVDFQYVGGGCGMVDLAYFVGSCFPDDEAEQREAEIVDYYFEAMRGYLKENDGTICPDALEKDWRTLYRVAWANFHRFLKGWSPDHWKLSAYSERVTREVIASLRQEMV